MTVQRQAPPGVVLGALLIVIGLAFLAMRYLDAFEGMDLWPWFVIAPGAVLFVLGLILPNTGMVIGGSVVASSNGSPRPIGCWAPLDSISIGSSWTVVATIGLILAWQNVTGLWATWAWIWALIPTAAGVGSFLGGLRTGSAEERTSGLWQIVIGLALLAGFYIFFEEVLGLSGGLIPLPEWAMPAVLIVLGVLVLLRGFFGPRETDQPA